MASHACVQSPSLTADHDWKPHGGGASRPVEAREALALPVLAEPGHVVGVVGPEVEEHGTRMARRHLRQREGETGEDETREDDEDRSRGQRGTADLARSARRQRHVPYVTSTAA